jgi:hypothetical protein
MPPNMGFLDVVNTYLPYTVAVVVAISFMVFFFWYRLKYMPEIARTFTTAYHSRGLPAFIQDEMGNVSLHICDKKFPEGVVHIRQKGWFLLPNPPPPEDEFSNLVALGAPKRKGPGRPPKNSQPQDTVQGEQASVKQPDEVIIQRRNLDDMSEAEKKSYVMAHGILVQTPILRGFGKQVFFGSSVSAALSNLNAISHADLTAVRLLSPKMYQKTQLDALATGSRIEGMKMAGKELTKLIMYAIIVIAPIAVVGLIVYLLTQPRAAILFGVF